MSRADPWNFDDAHVALAYRLMMAVLDENDAGYRDTLSEFIASRASATAVIHALADIAAHYFVCNIGLESSPKDMGIAISDLQGAIARLLDKDEP